MKPDGPEHCKRDEDRVKWMRSVMDRHEGPLLRYAARILGGDLERGRDIVQETFLKLWKSDQFGVDDNAAQWLFAVCRNGAVDVLRKEKRMIGLSEEIKRTQIAPGNQPHADAEKQEAAGQVNRAMAQLPENQQEVLRLKFQNGFTYKQIARITGLSVSGVGFQIHTAMQTLRKKFKIAGLVA
ncbi:MAG: sigma-70 family RNA polymerase sigma factor [Phycisphaerae bacterium]|jgi:RNA polymerase sigma-70 factor (ECF subfamily)|nr:sigma-70 family RNA polymerase sigma factor [Phycisphaerae bacterium]